MERKQTWLRPVGKVWIVPILFQLHVVKNAEEDLHMEDFVNNWGLVINSETCLEKVFPPVSLKLVPIGLDNVKKDRKTSRPHVQFAPGKLDQCSQVVRLKTGAPI